ncbi:MAG: tetratricopeptide repeat protein [Armatimonadetes bacterium]|nr:tetratricopeptide repeat protein [Armatimonadota bacterium]
MNLFRIVAPALLLSSLVAPLQPAAMAAPVEEDEPVQAAPALEDDRDAETPDSRPASEDGDADGDTVRSDPAPATVPGSVDYWLQETRDNPKSYAAHYNLGLAYAGRERWEDAIDAYRQAVEKSPEDKSELAWAYLAMGIAYGNMKRPQDEIASFRQATEADPEYDKAWFNLGNAYIKQKNYSAAVRAYQEVVKRNPDDPRMVEDAWYNMAVANQLLGRPAEAIPAYRKVVDAQPEDAQAWYQLGIAQGNAKQYANEIESYRRAIKLNEYLPGVFQRLGTAYAQTGKWDQALWAYKQALYRTRDQNDPDVWFNIGATYLKLGKTKEGLYALRQTRRLDPADAEAGKILNTLQNANSGVVIRSVILRSPRGSR